MLIKLNAALDIILGILLLALAVYFLYTNNNQYALWSAAGAVISFLFAKLKPGRWLARQVLLFQSSLKR